ncbi:MAG TPA: hypothetical protein VFL80_00980, partial [Thermoanaerobaculia bacterium]|nr:hypothetical protein [Thermoanaerobaculia bacterium]
DLRMSPEYAALGLARGGAVASIVIAAIAGFWVFRLEIGDRSIGSFVLAARSPLIGIVATLHAFVLSLCAFFIVIMCVGLLTAHLPPKLGSLFLLTACGCLVAGSLGIALATVSADMAMVVPVLAGATGICIAVWQLVEPAVFAGTLVAGALLLTIATLLLERRCAA